MYVRIKKAFEYRNERGEKITAPRGWIGELPEEHGKAALASGHAVPGDPRALPGEPPVGDEPDLDAMTRAELDKLAAERGIDVSKAKNKDEVIAALRSSAA
ncbi:hypothetical protein BHAOGJBA_1700 [Methylobacterium hispanicum]|uniref:Rho termination factor N-terminal domain-containing protein n=1 Tax=Methylobacterium hispanicum TaxID=270350 RepID=A0AAV4ZJ50_9HYPH|nr:MULTISPECIES: hypothetical protein [Methylobacterium]GJD88187.1 hypothetical protein BHAOGJBA_1700 [Methylobacterium hispanicum]